MPDKFSKPSIVRPSAKVRWHAGEQFFHASSPKAQMSSTEFDGVHWQMVDVEEAVRRLLSAEKRLSAENRAKNWGVRNFTEAKIRAFLAEHSHDPQVI
jgi:diketogulonate reductase-like aldo/keto reductase